MGNQFESVPAEMRAFNSWVLWTLVERPNGKATKIPIQALNGERASVTNPAHWCSFEDAVANVERGNGIGFVFSSADPFCGIDIDNISDEANRELQTRVWNAFPSYTEKSPSQNGFHIIVKGSIPCGRRRMSVECYNDARYFTVTADIVRDLPIIDCQEMLDVLWSEMSKGGKPNPYFETEDGEQLRQDDDIIKTAANATNGDKFTRLNDGNFDGYPSQSEADQAYINMLSFYTDSKTQVARIFLASPLGQREKAWKHPSYLRNTIHKSFDRKIPPIDLSEVQASLKQLVQRPAVQVQGPITDPIPWPPGLIGDIADYIYKQAPRPVHDVALVGALGLAAGICGQAYNVSGTGLNLYAILIAETGRGKEGMASGINKLTGEVCKLIPTAEDFLGPGDMASGAGLMAWLETSSCFVSVMGEIGHRLQTICSPTAPTHEQDLKRLLLDLYGKSGMGQRLKPKAYSSKSRKEHVIIERPAFTLIGESTPEKFFEALNDSLITDGFLPRFLIVQYDGDRKYLSKEFTAVAPPIGIVNQLAELVTHCREITHGNRVENIRFDSDAELLMDEFDRWTTDQINADHTEKRFAELYNRAHMKALRLAGLVAVGQNRFFPTVSKECAEWAIQVVMREVNNIMFRFKSGETGGKREGNQMEHIQIIRMILRGWFVGETKGQTYGLTKKMIDEGVFSSSSLNVRLNGHKAFKNDRRGVPAAVKDALKIMCEDGELSQLMTAEVKNRFGKTCLAYQYVEFEKLKG